jgi:vanillate O-demethylase ferredoxin subunit
LRSSVGFDPRLSPGARTLDRHRIVGLYASCIVLASALTGLPQAFDWYRKGIYVVTGSPQPDQKPRSTPAADAHRLPMETYWQRTQLLVPRQREALLHFPSRPRDPVEIFVIADDAPHANARTMIFLDAYRGSVLRYTPYSQSSLGNRVYFWTLSWHTGAIGGPVGPLVLLFGALSIPFLAYSGTASYVRRRLKARAADARLTVTVTRKTLEAADICSFELMDPSGKSLPAFTAGSHIDVHLRDGLVRQYSLCSDPRDRHRYLIGVLRAAGSRGGSDALHDYVREGDVIEISRPKNYFPLAPAADRSLLLAGGIGITPLICMAEQLAGSGATFEMHYSARSVERAAFLARLRRSPFANRVSFHFSNDPLSAHLDIATVLQHPDPGTHIYVCGPQGFMDAVLAMAARQGWPEHCLHREYFAADTRSGKNDTEFDVRIASTGKICRVAKDETVVAALSRCGIRVPTSCTQGVCGMCLTRVIEGDPDHRDLFQSAAERMRNDQFTPCCSRANSALLVLDL